MRGKLLVQASRAVTNIIRQRDGLNGTRHNMTGANGTVFAFQSRFKQLRIREDNAKLIVQLMEQSPKIGKVLFHRKPHLPCAWCWKRNIARHTRWTLNVLRHGQLSPCLLTSVGIGFTPKRVDKNTHRTTCCSNVFNLSTRNPVVDRPTAHTNQLARFHDRNCFSVNNHRFTRHLQTKNAKSTWAKSQTRLLPVHGIHIGTQ